MNLGQLLLVLLAVVLFSTIVITIWNNMMNQVDLADRSLYSTQAIKIADKLFQEYESKILGNLLAFHDMYAELDSSLTLPVIGVGEANYTPTITSIYCDSLNNIILIPTVPPPNRQVVFVSVLIETAKRSYTVGEQDDLDFNDEHFLKIFTDMGIMTGP
jgi:hypothetical protein